MVSGMPMSQASVEPIELFLKAGAGADGELTHKVRIFRKCFNFLPWPVLQFVSGLAAIFVVAVDGVGFNFNRCFSSSVDICMLSTQNYLILSCQCATSLLLLSTDFSSPIGTHAREALQSIIILIGAATRKIMDGRERGEAEKELEKQGGWTDEKEEKRKKSWRCKRRNK